MGSSTTVHGSCKKALEVVGKMPSDTVTALLAGTVSGYYAGFLSAAIMMGQAVSARLWGVVSDRYGSRFVMAFGLVSTVVLSVAFGLSTTLTAAFTTRFLLGLLNGMISASKTLVSEVCGKEHETVGMGVVTTSWSLGSVLGPGIGGILAEPAKHHPRTFSRFGLFGRYPYLLPNAVAAGMALLSLPLVLLFLDGNPNAGDGTTKTHDEKLERPITAVPVPSGYARVATPLPYGLDNATVPSSSSYLPRYTRARTWCLSWCHSYSGGDGNDATDNDGGEGGDGPASTAASALPTKPNFDAKKISSVVQTEKTPMIAAPGLRSGNKSEGGENTLGCNAGELKPRSLLAQPHIRNLLVINALYSLTCSGFNEVYSLWSLSTIASGGLDWSTVQIGQVFLACGFMVLGFELFAVPNLTSRLGVRVFQRVGSVFDVPAYFLLPVLSTANRSGFPVASAALLLLFTVYAGSNAFYIGLSLAVNNATGPRRRGELNGIAMAVTCVAKSISPIAFSALFAFSIDGGSSHPFPFDYHFVFYLIGGMRLAVACMAWTKINDTQGGRMEKHALVSEEEEEDRGERACRTGFEGVSEPYAPLAKS